MGIRKALLFFFTLSLTTVQAQRISLREKPLEILKKRNFATLLILVIENDDVIGKGAGFFYGSDGTIVTNRHVLEQFLNDEKKKLKLKVMSVKDGPLEDVELGYCGKKTEVDICFLRSKMSAKKFFFPINNAKIGVGHSVHTFGHCKEVFAYKKGKILKFIKSDSKRFDEEGQFGLERIVTDLEICPGDSGGPIFTDRGDLVGINVGAGTEVYKGTKKIKYVGASYNEITKLMQNKTFRKIPINRLSIPKK